MEQVDWTLLDEDDELVSHESAERVREHAAAGCLMCALDDWDDE
jgi:hypothetical protein